MSSYTMDKDMNAAIQCGLCDISCDVLQQTYIAGSIDLLQKLIEYYREFGEIESEAESNLELAETAFGILTKISKNISNNTDNLELYVQRIQKLYGELKARNIKTYADA